MPETIVKHEGYTITITPLMEKGCSYSITSDYKGAPFTHKECPYWFPSIADAVSCAMWDLIHYGGVKSKHDRKRAANTARDEGQMEMKGLLNEAITENKGL